MSPPDLPITVPPTLAVPAGGTASFTIGVEKSALGPGVARHATLTLAHKKYRVQLPITAVGDFPLPDLAVTAVSVSSPLEVGNPMTVAVTAANQGGVDSPPFYVSVVLSADTSLSAEDVYFGNCYFPAGVAASAAGPCGFTDTFVASATPGTYHVLAVADSAITVLEHDETNNVTVMPGTVQVQ